MISLCIIIDEHFCDSLYLQCVCVLIWMMAYNFFSYLRLERCLVWIKNWMVLILKSGQR